MLLLILAARVASVLTFQVVWGRWRRLLLEVAGNLLRLPGLGAT